MKPYTTPLRLTRKARKSRCPPFEEEGKDGTDIMLTEINFDGIIGPTHHYAGLSRGNIASASNAGCVSQPRAAARQGLAQMRRNLTRGLRKGFFVPRDRPDRSEERGVGATGVHGCAYRW